MGRSGRLYQAPQSLHKGGHAFSSGGGQCLGDGDRAPTGGGDAAIEPGAASPVPENGSRRETGGRDRARLQQSADGHPGVQRVVAGVPGPARSAAKARRRNQESRRLGGVAHTAAPGFQPPTGLAAKGLGPERGRQHHGPHAATGHRRRYRSGPCLGPRPQTRQGRSGTDRTGHHEPCGQRPGRHAGGGTADGRDVQCHAGSSLCQ